MVFAKAVQRRDQRAGIARWAQPQIDLVSVAFAGARLEDRDQPLHDARGRFAAAGGRLAAARDRRKSGRGRSYTTSRPRPADPSRSRTAQVGRNRMTRGDFVAASSAPRAEPFRPAPSARSGSRRVRCRPRGRRSRCAEIPDGETIESRRGGSRNRRSAASSPLSSEASSSADRCNRARSERTSVSSISGWRMNTVDRYCSRRTGAAARVGLPDAPRAAREKKCARRSPR